MALIIPDKELLLKDKSYYERLKDRKDFLYIPSGRKILDIIQEYTDKNIENFRYFNSTKDKSGEKAYSSKDIFGSKQLCCDFNKNELFITIISKMKNNKQIRNIIKQLQSILKEKQASDKLIKQLQTKTVLSINIDKVEDEEINDQLLEPVPITKREISSIEINKKQLTRDNDGMEKAFDLGSLLHYIHMQANLLDKEIIPKVVDFRNDLLKWGKELEQELIYKDSNSTARKQIKQSFIPQPQSTEPVYAEINNSGSAGSGSGSDPNSRYDVLPAEGNTGLPAQNPNQSVYNVPSRNDTNQSRENQGPFQSKTIPYIYGNPTGSSVNVARETVTQPAPAPDATYAGPPVTQTPPEGTDAMYATPICNPTRTRTRCNVCRSI